MLSGALHPAAQRARFERELSAFAFGKHRHTRETRKANGLFRQPRLPVFRSSVQVDSKYLAQSIRDRASNSFVIASIIRGVGDDRTTYSWVTIDDAPVVTQRAPALAGARLSVGAAAQILVRLGRCQRLLGDDKR